MLQSQQPVEGKSAHTRTAADMLYACSGFRHSTKDGCHYNIRFRPHELVVAGETFCGRVECSPDGTRCRFCDDPSNFYSFPRELGAVTIADDQMCVLLPRVRAALAARSALQVRLREVLRGLPLRTVLIG